MTTVQQSWWGHVQALATETIKLWWRCLPVMIVGLTLGLTSYHVLLLTAAVISDQHPWLAVGVLSLGFGCLLVGYLFCLRAAGRMLGIGAHLESNNLGENLVDQSLSHLVAMTLLPFMGIYAVFGKVQEVSGQLVTYEAITRGVLSKGVLSTLNPTTGRQMLIILAVLGGTFVVRRTFDELLERTGHRLFGFLTALTEAFFMLVLIYGGTRTINRGKDWLGERRFAGWVRDAIERLPDWLTWGWDKLFGPVWDVVAAGLGQPLLWLAVAAMAFGSRVMSAAELWRETVGNRATPRRLPVPKLDALAKPGPQRVWVEMKELFFGDIDDKYLPTWQSLRLVLSAGMGLIGAFCLLHALTRLATWLVRRALQFVLGPNRSDLWVAWGLPQDLLEMLAGEPLRLCLLAVTFARCVTLLAQRAGEEVSA